MFGFLLLLSASVASLVFTYMAFSLAEYLVKRSMLLNKRTLFKALPIQSKKLKKLSILLVLLILGGCCAKTPEIVVKKGQIIHLRACEIYSECPLDETSLRQIAMNNEKLK